MVSTDEVRNDYHQSEAETFHSCRGCETNRNLRPTPQQFREATPSRVHRRAERGSQNRKRAAAVHDLGHNRPSDVVLAMHALSLVFLGPKGRTNGASRQRNIFIFGPIRPAFETFVADGIVVHHAASELTKMGCGHGEVKTLLWDAIMHYQPRVLMFSALKRLLLILSDRIFDSSVDRAIPSLAAALNGPNTRPWLSRRAASMISFS